MLNNLLVYRFLIFNTAAISGVVALWVNGIVEPIFTHDPSRITVAIAALFIIGWCWTFREAVRTSSELNDAKRCGGARPRHAQQRNKDLAKISWLGSVTEWLVALGLIGTVWGFSVALSGIDQGSLGQVAGAQSAVGGLMAGMRIALNTTLLGLSLAVWHDVNLRMIWTAHEVLWADRVQAYDKRRPLSD